MIFVIKLRCIWKNCLDGNCPRRISFCLQLGNDITIPTLDHLIEEEIVAGYLHVTYYSNVRSKPNIGLFAYGSIEPPLAIGSNHLAKGGRIAIALAVQVSDFVLALEMENIDGFAGVFEILIVDSTLVGIELAIIVENEIFGSGFRGWKGGLCECLDDCQFRWSIDQHHSHSQLTQLRIQRE